ncbi:MAG: TatD family hydrolase [Oscillospiraceae bacterium]|nr:TatD family hydrolase [Oscillospiraceae bacterium]
MFDMHCHVDLIDPMNRFCATAAMLNISILAMTTTPKAYYAETRMLANYSSVNVALGLHPQLVSERKQELAIFDRYAASSRFIGEVGLDFSKRFYSSKEDQIIVFEHIIQSCARAKTISIHSAFADKQVLDILDKYKTTEHNNCILHWYSGSLAQLERAIEMGCYFSINEQMLKSINGTKIIERIPIERIVLESDAPFVAGINKAELLQGSLTRTQDGLSKMKDGAVKNILDYTSRILLGI